MEDVSLTHAKDHLEELVRRAARGEEIHISDATLGTVRLTRVRAPDLHAPRVTDTMEVFLPLPKDRVPGRLKGKMKVPERLMEPMSEEELRDWYGDDA
jgi:antitoxin (DNA-binding transcriptional repressor) of toxin-antitoxin stability system